MKLKRVGPLSCAKVAAILYSGIGLVVGFCISLAALLGVAIGAAAGDEPGMAVLGLLFGVGAVVVLPIVYGLAGFLSALVGAALYNLAARVTGGIELELE
jgi:hypothetical protein